MLAGIGYLLSTVSYTLLLLLLLTVRKSGLAKHLLLLAVAGTSLWSISFILLDPITMQQLLVFDGIKQLFWVVFITSCLKKDFNNLSHLLSRPITLFALLWPALAIGLPFVVGISANWLFLLQTIIALEVLILLEVIYRQAGDDRWAFKPLILFLGAINLFEFVTYANATMVEQLEPAYLEARGYVYTVFVPFLVLAIRRVEHWGIEIFVSRDVVLHSSLLMVAGGYLFIMALIGYAINFVGGEWSHTIQIVFIFLSLGLLLTLFLSQGFRTQAKVFITKHFFANQFDYRIEWVKLTNALQGHDTNLSQVYDKSLQALLDSIEYESGVLVKAGPTALEPLSFIKHESLSPTEVEIIEQLARYCQQQHWIVDLVELRHKPFVYPDLKINHGLLNSCAFQLVMPIFNSDELWGFALLDSGENETKKLNWELRDYLWAVAAQVSSYLLSREAAQEVAENAQFAAFSRMSAFVLHDLKNVLAQIDLILCNAEQHKDNPEFIDDTFETLQHTKARMEKMLRQLTEKEAVKNKAEGLCDIPDLVKSVVERRCAGLLPKPNIEVIEHTEVVLDKDKLANVLYHLISNAQQATQDDGKIDIKIALEKQRKYLVIDIIDTGEGMTQTFITERLFKPFDTTKGNAGMGIGAYDAKSYLEKIGGQLLVNSQEQIGTTFTLYLPVD